MKLIKIFLASSEEMDYDRMVFGNLVRRLNDLYERRGVRLKLFEWEDYDSAFNDRRKQDEYNEKVRESDVFLALFHKKAGEFTVEEFDVASEAFREKASPKVYTFLRDLRTGETASPELEKFKHRLFEEMGHFWCRYDNRDSLQFQFVMQLQLVENNMSDSLKVEDGEVRIDGMKVASMDKLRFAAGNEDYVKMSEELAALPEKIEKARLRLEKFPDDEDLIDDLQQKLDRYNKLKEEFSNYQKILFDTAKRIARLQSERITDRMRRAMDAFNEGKVREANIILDEAEADARRNLEDFKQFREITEQKRETVICSLEELLLKTSTVMADAGIPIEERIIQTEKIYAQADEMAREIGYDEKKYADLLWDYGHFLLMHTRYESSLNAYERALRMMNNLAGCNRSEIAALYNNIGYVYSFLGNYSNAQENLRQSLNLKLEILGENHKDTALTYNNIGLIYYFLDDYEKALEYFKKSLSIYERIRENDDVGAAWPNNNIGAVYESLDEFDEALAYYKKALDIRERAYGESHPEIASSLNNIGFLLAKRGDYSKGLDYCNRALAIQLKELGEFHLDTANTYDSLGHIYLNKGDKDLALKFYRIALKIYHKVFGPEDRRTIEAREKVDDVMHQIARS